jgi:hypothetical protein
VEVEEFMPVFRNLQSSGRAKHADLESQFCEMQVESQVASVPSEHKPPPADQAWV